MKQITKYPLVLLFAAFIAVLSVLDMFVSRREFSEMENRYLQLKPTFTVKSLMNGKYTSTYETYINDQFVLRDNWISLKSRTEYLIGKQENNSVVYGKDHYMFDKLDRLDEERIKQNLSNVKEFFTRYSDTPATFAVIPNSYAVLSDKLPYGLALVDQFAYIDKWYAEVGGTGAATLSLKESLLEHKDNYIYYMTDHHWTTYGAYLAYSDYVRSRGMEPVEYDSLTANEVKGFYGTYFSKSKLFNAVPDIITWMDIPTTSVTIDGGTTIFDSNKQEVPVTGLYWQDKFETRDKYAAFLYGNNGVTVIQSENNRYHSEGKTSRILVIKDSYGNSMVPYLTYNYDEVVVLDLRAIPFNMSEFMAENEFDEILLLYNFKNFSEDINFTRLKY
ncbi:hypothetical protein H8711_00375 [Clostridiaceae bacterium NSJ-31]|uniref:DHHW protein n=1 Tax=Ligaoa zhengdingensis TaxID=2763658 RepID=A0A926I3Q8_9FIRM|nr:DHHW family protein [Ligaoa zhengdingensis]MBC8545391.1 hypothetical protein [Ligaoa zhengdingensis]